MAERALTLRLDEETYQRLRREAFDREVSMTSLIRDALVQPERGPLAILPNPPIPADEWLHDLFGAAGGDDWTIKGLRSVWRAGCDAGMVADRKATTLQEEE